jgi:hypothetical protein
MSEGPATLRDIRSPDGSRRFAEIPDRFAPTGWQRLERRLAATPGVTKTSIIDAISQANIDFTYRGYNFTADTQFGELWLFTEKADCPDEILLEVIGLF